MNLIQLIACIGLITGCFVLLHISPMDFTEGVFRRITSKPKSIRSEVNESTRRKKKSSYNFCSCEVNGMGRKVLK